eukprot:gene2351-3647_t
MQPRARRIVVIADDSQSNDTQRKEHCQKIAEALQLPLVSALGLSAAEEQLAQERCTQGAVLYDFPSTVEQAAALDALLAKTSDKVELCIAFSPEPAKADNGQ